MDAFEIFEQMFSGGIFNEHEQREQEEAAQQAAQALEGLELELACGGNSDYRLLYSEEEDEEEDECVGSDAGLSYSAPLPSALAVPQGPSGWQGNSSATLKQKSKKEGGASRQR